MSSQEEDPLPSLTGCVIDFAHTKRLREARNWAEHEAGWEKTGRPSSRALLVVAPPSSAGQSSGGPIKKQSRICPVLVPRNCTSDRDTGLSNYDGVDSIATIEVAG